MVTTSIVGLMGLGWQTCLAVAVLSYILLCTHLRHRQRLAMQARFAQFNTDESLSKMSVSQAHIIQTWLAEQEFPLTFSAALFFALFKVSTARVPLSRTRCPSDHGTNRRTASRPSRASW